MLVDIPPVDRALNSRVLSRGVVLDRRHPGSILHVDPSHNVLYAAPDPRSTEDDHMEIFGWTVVHSDVDNGPFSQSFC